MDNIVTMFDSKETDRILRDLGMNTEQLVRAIGFDVEGLYVQTARKDTGAMRNSAYTVTNKVDGYKTLPDAITYPHPKPKKGHAHTGPSVEYAIYQEEGTRRGINADHALRNAGNRIFAAWKSGSRWKGLVK